MRRAKGVPVKTVAEQLRRQNVRHAFDVIARSRVSLHPHAELAQLLDPAPDLLPRNANFLGDFRAADDDRRVLREQSQQRVDAPVRGIRRIGNRFVSFVAIAGQEGYSTARAPNKDARDASSVCELFQAARRSFCYSASRSASVARRSSTTSRAHCSGKCLVGQPVFFDSISLASRSISFCSLGDFRRLIQRVARRRCAGRIVRSSEPAPPRRIECAGHNLVGQKASKPQQRVVNLHKIRHATRSGGRKLERQPCVFGSSFSSARTLRASAIISCSSAIFRFRRRRRPIPTAVREIGRAQSNARLPAAAIGATVLR